MAIPLYLAMTAAEFRRSTALPDHIAWLSCLFSPYSTGLSNIPKQLPPGSLLILSDRTPVCGHDPGLIKAQLEEAVVKLHCSGLLLDLQRPACQETTAIVRELTGLSCPVAVSEAYSRELDCPVFLPPVPPDVPLEEHLAPWDGREIWLDAAMETQTITITEDGAKVVTVPAYEANDKAFRDEALQCHYDIHVSDIIRFTLQRTKKDLSTLLEKAGALGVTRAVGLYQEFA